MRESSSQTIQGDKVELHRASDADIPAVVSLLNRAYRGAGPEASWNTEAPYIGGDRTSESLLRREIADKPHGCLLVTDIDGAVRGCVWLEPLGQDVWYLGSLAVEPRLQDARVGRGLLEAAEAWVRARGGRTIRMSVVNVRDTLIAWYERRGYQLTGETEPFPYDDARFGVPKRPDLCFVLLKKDL